MATCRKCGAEHDHTVEMVIGLEAEAEVTIVVDTLCKPCFQSTHEQMRFMKREFEALIARGMSRVEANEYIVKKYALDPV